jgi:hypothetical protein
MWRRRSLGRSELSSSAAGRAAPSLLQPRQ